MPLCRGPLSKRVQRCSHLKLACFRNPGGCGADPSYTCMQARDTCDDFLESGQRPSTSLSIPRSLSQPRTALLQHALQAQHSLQQEQQQLQEQGPPSYSSSNWQQHDGLGPELCQGHQGNNPEKHSGPPPSLCVPAALQVDGGPAEQFLQLLQQELNKVWCCCCPPARKPQMDWSLHKQSRLPAAEAHCHNSCCHQKKEVRPAYRSGVQQGIACLQGGSS